MQKDSGLLRVLAMTEIHRTTPTPDMHERLKTAYQELLGKGRVTICLKIQTNARKLGVLGMLDDGSIKIGIAVAPEQGKANDAIIAYLKQEMQLGSEYSYRYLQGKTATRKVLLIELN